MSGKVQTLEPSASEAPAAADNRLLDELVAALAPRLIAALASAKTADAPTKIRAERPVSAKLTFRRPASPPSDLMRTKARAICRRMGLPMRTD